MAVKWQCPICKREFAKINQAHSCVVFPLENHFKNKEFAKSLFEHLKNEIEKNIGPLKVESLPCCIHFVSAYTFGAVWAKKDRIMIDFRIPEKLESNRFKNITQISAHRFLYYLDIYKKEEIDPELLTWIKRSYELHEE